MKSQTNRKGIVGMIDRMYASTYWWAYLGGWFILLPYLSKKIFTWRAGILFSFIDVVVIGVIFLWGVFYFISFDKEKGIDAKKIMLRKKIKLPFLALVVFGLVFIIYGTYPYYEDMATMMLGRSDILDLHVKVVDYDTGLNGYMAAPVITPYSISGPEIPWKDTVIDSFFPFKTSYDTSCSSMYWYPLMGWSYLKIGGWYDVKILKYSHSIYDARKITKNPIG